jgi:recombination protein RecA
MNYQIQTKPWSFQKYKQEVTMAKAKKLGKPAGIPVGKVVEIAGLEGSGKSYMAAQIAANAQKKDIDVIYFDSESAIDPSFLQNAGCDIGRLLYVQAQSVEFVLETIEELLGSNDNRMLFVWDSLALTPAISDVDGEILNLLFWS